MKNLYLLTEDDNDDLFYERCLEELTRDSFQLMEPIRVRQSSGISKIRKTIRYLLNVVKNSGVSANIHFLIVMDNDRRPEHPDHITKALLLYRCRCWKAGCF